MDLSTFFPIEIDEDSAGLRLDFFLAQKFPEVSRSRWAKVLDQRRIHSFGKILSSSHKIKKGDCLEIVEDKEEIFFMEEAPFKKKNIVFCSPEKSPKVLFEDEEILVLNKPIGLGVHPGNGLPLEETLVAWLVENKKISDPTSSDFLKWGEELLEEGRPGIVHRLDKATSGVLVVAKNPKALTHLSKQFESRTAGREYWAVVEGSLERLIQNRPARLEALLRHVPSPVALRREEGGKFSFASFLERDPKMRIRFQVSSSPSHGKKAITHFHEIRTTQEFSWIHLKLDTGRTHQIRVHLSFLGFPILGDELYGGRPHSRLFLHAHTLHFKHPKTSKELEFHAPLPSEDLSWLEEKKLK